jgi:hypothetical protein
MKKLVWLAMIAFMLTACSARVDIPGSTPIKSPEGTPSCITEVQGLTVADVSAIWRFDDSQPPDTPSRIIYREKELQVVLQGLQSVQLTGLDEPKETAAPGDYWSYRVYLFDGNIVLIRFNSHRVIVEGKEYKYQNVAPLQQALDNLGTDPFLPGNNAYEDVVQIKVAAAGSEYSVDDREQMNAIIRMFHHMTIDGRSRNELKDGAVYTLCYKDGSEIQLKYKDGQLATSEGTYQVKVDPSYFVPVETSNPEATK